MSIFSWYTRKEHKGGKKSNNSSKHRNSRRIYTKNSSDFNIHCKIQCYSYMHKNTYLLRGVITVLGKQYATAWKNISKLCRYFIPKISGTPFLTQVIKRCWGDLGCNRIKINIYYYYAIRYFYVILD